MSGVGTHFSSPPSQFERLRDGDRFWYERKGMFTPQELSQIHNTVCPSPYLLLLFILSQTILSQQTLMQIIERNINVTAWGQTPGETFWLQQRYLSSIGMHHVAWESSQLLTWPVTGGDQFFQNTGEYQFYVDLSPAYRLSWTPDKANNAIHMMIQVRR